MADENARPTHEREILNLAAETTVDAARTALEMVAGLPVTGQRLRLLSAMCELTTLRQAQHAPGQTDYQAFGELARRASDLADKNRLKLVTTGKPLEAVSDGIEGRRVELLGHRRVVQALEFRNVSGAVTRGEDLGA